MKASLRGLAECRVHVSSRGHVDSVHAPSPYRRKPLLELTGHQTRASSRGNADTVKACPGGLTERARASSEDLQVQGLPLHEELSTFGTTASSQGLTDRQNAGLFARSYSLTGREWKDERRKGGKGGMAHEG